MAYCKKCGTELDEEAKFCPSCGQATDSADTAEKIQDKLDDVTENIGENFDDAAEKIKDAFEDFNSTKDSTAEYSESDRKDNLVMALLSYIGILVLVPIFASESKYVRFHANQGLVLFICEIILAIAGAIIGIIPILGWIVAPIFGFVFGLVALAFAIIGIINVAMGRAKELPLIGGIKILK